MVIDLAHPAGLVSAVLVGVGVLGGGFTLLRTMLGNTGGGRPEPIVPLPIKRYRRILVPTGVGMCHDDYVTEAARLACNLAAKKGNHPTEVVFTYVIPVPRALALTAELPEEEAEAQRLLDAAAALAHSCGLTKVVTQLRKGRTVIDETLRAVEQEQADLVILTPQTHAAAGAPMPLENSQGHTTVPATQAAVIQAVHAGCSVPMGKAGSCGASRCYAELDTVETSDKSETVTGKLLRRLSCEAIVARQAGTVTAATGRLGGAEPALAFSRN